MSQSVRAEQSSSPLRFNAAVTVDVVIFTVAEGRLKTLLVKRKQAPYQGVRAITGGFLQPQETPDHAAVRILKTKAGIRDVYLEQLYTFDRQGRDPRGQVISVTYFALVPEQQLANLQGDALEDPQLFDALYLPDIAFDHDHIINYAVRRLRNKLTYSNIAFSLLPAEFTLTQLQNTYEIIIGQQLDKRNFRKRFLALDLIEETDSQLRGGRHRPASLYRFIQRSPVEVDRVL